MKKKCSVYTILGSDARILPFMKFQYFLWDFIIYVHIYRSSCLLFLWNSVHKIGFWSYWHASTMMTIINQLRINKHPISRYSYFTFRQSFRLLYLVKDIIFNWLTNRVIEFQMYWHISKSIAFGHLNSFWKRNMTKSS